VHARFRAPRFELADIVRTHRPALERAKRLSPTEQRALTDIAQCRTAKLGGHLDVCEHCGYEQPSYNSCRNRHCPKCQALAQEKWIEQQRARLVDAPHFHVVFTLPAELRPLAAFAPRVLPSTRPRHRHRWWPAHGRPMGFRGAALSVSRRGDGIRLSRQDALSIAQTL